MTRATPDPNDLPTPPAASPSPYHRQLAVKILRYTVYNFRINNRMVNRLWVAQKCFRNALIVLVAGGIVTTTLFIAAAPAPPSGLRMAQALARTAGCDDLPFLKMDRKGRWSGTCLQTGKIANVLVNGNGQTEFPP